MTRPAGRVISFLDSHGSSWVGSGGLTVRFGPGQEVLKSHGLGRVGTDRPGPTRPARTDLIRETPWFIALSGKTFVADGVPQLLFE